MSQKSLPVLAACPEVDGGFGWVSVLVGFTAYSCSMHAVCPRSQKDCLVGPHPPLPALCASG